MDETCVEPTRVLFINLDDVETEFGFPPDATNNIHNLFVELVGSWIGYSQVPAEREALIEAIAEQWAPYRVVVTDVRPEAVGPPYMMVVVTSSPGPVVLMGSPWVAFPDCDDMLVRDVAMAFLRPDDLFSVQQRASLISGAIARTLGLVFTDSADITGFGDEFLDKCVAVEPADGSCVPRPGLCPVGMQNSHLELEARLGLMDPQ